MSIGEPPSASMRLSWPWAKKPRDRLSGDQKGQDAPSVPVRAEAFRASSDWMYICDLPGEPATNAIRRPSGEMATGAGASPVAKNCVPSGGEMTQRMRTED